MTTFFDTSVLFSVLNDHETHHAWSVAQLQAWQAQGPIVESSNVAAGRRNRRSGRASSRTNKSDKPQLQQSILTASQKCEVASVPKHL